MSSGAETEVEILKELALESIARVEELEAELKRLRDESSRIKHEQLKISNLNRQLAAPLLGPMEQLLFHLRELMAGDEKLALRRAKLAELVAGRLPKDEK